MGPALTLLRALLEANPKRTKFESSLLSELAALAGAGGDVDGGGHVATHRFADPSTADFQMFTNLPSGRLATIDLDGVTRRLGTDYRLSCGEKSCLFKLDAGG